MSPFGLGLRDKTVLVAGGAGYVGSHAVRALLENGFRDVVVFDNLSTGHKRLVPDGVELVEGDLRNPADLEAALSGRRVDAVMHFAASSLVGESVEDPLKYWENNVSAAVSLLKAMAAHGVRKIVFSSTAAVYGEPVRVPIEEDDRTLPVNPYGQTKLAIERLLADAERAGLLRYAALRYFNACGAHRAGGAGECHDPETHLIPNALRAVSGEIPALTVFGDDYPTPDGTCLRDYVHVEDLADAHVKALESLERGDAGGAFNLGCGEGFSVKEVLAAVERAAGKPVPARVGPRRAGDPAKLVASSAKARRLLGWSPKIGLDEIARTAWEWHCKEREGAETAA